MHFTVVSQRLSKEHPFLPPPKLVPWNNGVLGSISDLMSKAALKYETNNVVQSIIGRFVWEELCASDRESEIPDKKEQRYLSPWKSICPSLYPGSV